jgi:hypothetical protein
MILTAEMTGKINNKILFIILMSTFDSKYLAWFWG